MNIDISILTTKLKIDNRVVPLGITHTRFAIKLDAQFHALLKPVGRIFMFGRTLKRVATTATNIPSRADKIILVV